MKHILKTGLLAGAIGLAATMAQAVSLLPGTTIFATGTTAADDPELAGTIINDNDLSETISIPDPGSIFFVGFDIQNRVVRSDATGQLIFAPRVKFGANVTGGNFLIEAMILFGYGEYDMDFAYRTDGLGDRGVSLVDRTPDGERLDLDFGFPLVVGNLVQSVKEESHFLSIKTNATHFTKTGRATILGSHIDYPGRTFRLDYSGLAVPAMAPVPVPPSLLMMLSGLGALFGQRRRRANKQAA